MSNKVVPLCLTDEVWAQYIRASCTTLSVALPTCYSQDYKMKIKKKKWMQRPNLRTGKLQYIAFIFLGLHFRQLHIARLGKRRKSAFYLFFMFFPLEMEQPACRQYGSPAIVSTGYLWSQLSCEHQTYHLHLQYYMSLLFRFMVEVTATHCQVKLCHSISRTGGEKGEWQRLGNK